MSNKMLRVTLRTGHLVAAFVMVFSSAAPLTDTWLEIVQVVALVGMIITGVWMWQQGRIARFFSRRRNAVAAGD